MAYMADDELRAEKLAWAINNALLASLSLILLACKQNHQPGPDASRNAQKLMISLEWRLWISLDFGSRVCLTCCYPATDYITLGGSEIDFGGIFMAMAIAHVVTPLMELWERAVRCHYQRTPWHPGARPAHRSRLSRPFEMPLTLQVGIVETIKGWVTSPHEKLLAGIKEKYEVRHPQLTFLQP